MEGGKCICLIADMELENGLAAFPVVSESDFQTGGTEWVPDWREVRRRLEREAENYERTGGDRREIPLVIDTDPSVPWKHVATLIDIATSLSLDLTNLQFATPEEAYR